MNQENNEIQKTKKPTTTTTTAAAAAAESDDDEEIKSDDDDDEERQMIGGCCVCGDDSGFSNNLLVYCDGIDCQVAVHQACYGILNVPGGSWFCGSCKYKIELATNAIKVKPANMGESLTQDFRKIKCELCPCRDGAVKRTENGKWAHVVCALYIPEISFGSVRTMEPIVLKDIKAERLNKKCSICETNSETSTGVYVNCKKPGCKHWFHVTCAQAKGLLCEESSNKNNLTYSIYCKSHANKFSSENGRNIKQLPPFNINACTPLESNETNNVPSNVNNLIACVNKSIQSGQDLPSDLSNVLEASKEKVKVKINEVKKDKDKDKERRKTVPKIGKDPVVEFCEKKKKRFSFNAATVLQNSNKTTTTIPTAATTTTTTTQTPTAMANTNHKSIIKTKSSNSEHIESKITVTASTEASSLTAASNQDKAKIVRKSSNSQEAKPVVKNEPHAQPQTETKVNAEKIIQAKHVEPKVTEIKITEIKVTDITTKTPTSSNETKTDETLKNEIDCNSSIKSYRSTTSTSNSTSKRKANENQVTKEAKKSKKSNKSDDESCDEPTNHTTNLSLNINLDENKLGIVTPSTSSCASSITSNCAVETNEKVPKAKIRNVISNKQVECIDAFGNYINKVDKQKEKENLSGEAESLEELLTKQWELGESLLNESTKQFDVVDLLNLMNKCKQENNELENKIKLLEKNNSQLTQMNKKLCKPFTDNSVNHVTTTTNTNTTNTNTSTATTVVEDKKAQTQAFAPSLSNSFTKVINDQIQNHITSNSSTFGTPPPQSSLSNAFSYNSLINNLNFIQKANCSPTQTNSLLHLYSKAMHQGQSPTNQLYTPSAHYAASPSKQTTTTTSSSSSSSSSSANTLGVNPILSQNQLLQSFQQLNPLHQQHIASYYYMAAATANSSAAPAPGTSASFNH